MSGDTKLLPCPFCGGEAEMDTHQSYRNISTGRIETAIAVYCVACSARHSICRADVPDVQPAEVAELWNRRAPIAPADPLDPRDPDVIVDLQTGDMRRKEG